MAADETHIKEIRSLIAASKQQPVFFGFCLGAKPETDTLLMHRTKSAKSLSMEARTQAKGTKVAFGTATSEGSKLNLSCEEKPPSGLAKRTRNYLKAMKLNLKVRLVGADGEVFEEDGEEEADLEPGKTTQPGETDAAPAAAAAPPPPPPPPPPQEAVKPDADALKKELAALAARIPSAAAGDAARQAALVKLAREAQVNLGTSNLAYAVDSIAKLRAMLEAPATGEAKPAETAPPPPPPPPPPQDTAKPDASALKKELAELAARIPAAAGGDAARQAALVKLAREGQVALGTNNLNTASAAIAQLREAIDGKPSPDAPSGQAAPPQDLEKTKMFLARLKLLIGKAAADLGQEALWMKMADDAGDLLTSNPAAGLAAVEKLRLAMLPAVNRMQEEAKTAGAYTSSGKKWLDMRQTVEDEMEKLRLAIADAYKDDPALPAIEKAFRATTAPVLRTLDASLAVKLEAAGKAAKAEEREKLVEEAHGIVETYKSFAADKLLADLDDNPFVPLSLQASLNATLAELAAAIH